MLTVMLPRDLPDHPGSETLHPGAGTLTIDNALPDACVEALLQLWRGLPTAQKDKASPIDRSYYDDVDGWLRRAIDKVLTDLGLLTAPSADVAMAGVAMADAATADVATAGADQPAAASPATQPLMRFLHYPTVGGSLPAHVDLPRVSAEGVRTTHSFLLYLTDVATGGETLLLEARPGDAKLVTAGGVANGERRTLAKSAPRRGRLLLMPHACPHSAAETEAVPKTLIRGEVVLPGLLPQ